MAMKGDLPMSKLPQYILAQLLGAYVALVVYRGIKRAT